MTGYNRGDVVLVAFPFTNLSAVKRRPALIVSTEAYHAACNDVILAQITSRIDAPPRPGDHLVADWRGSGLLAPSLVRARLVTLHNSMIDRKLGTIPITQMQAIDQQLATALGLKYQPSKS